MEVRNRVKELRNIKSSELIPNPKNWRVHPPAQRDALEGVLEEIGIADALLARETPEGLMLIDGHLRQETLPDETVPVLILDIDEDEADKMLLTLDPLASMATRDEAQLTELLALVDTDNDAIKQMLRALSDNALSSLNDFPDFGEELDEGIAANIQLCVCECGHEHHRVKE